MPEWVREGLVKHSTSWQFRAALVLERETRRRDSAVRRLLWSDIDVENATVRWRAETDKSGRANVTPLTARAIRMLRILPLRGIGDAPVFPAARDPSKSSSRHAFQQWLKRAKRAWLRSIDDATERERVRTALRGVGFHSEKRAGVRDPEFRKLPAAIQEEIAGTNYTTLRRIYDEVTAEDIREAWAEARQVAK